MLSEPTHTPLPTFVLMVTFEKYKANNRQQNFSIDIEHVWCWDFSVAGKIFWGGQFLSYLKEKS